MEATANILRKFAEVYNNAKSEDRIEALYCEVISFAAYHAHMGHYRVNFDVYWDNNQETRRVCKRLWEEDILLSVTNSADEDITSSVLKNEPPKNHRLDPNEGITTLFLSWD